jgi:PIN domain nuclease of toxin-antitoxin system
MGVTYLLDTHALLWLLGEPRRLPGPLLDELSESETTLLVSAASAMEIATKHRIGKLPDAGPLIATWAARIGELGSSELPITAEHALRAGALDWPHRDPFDRLLAAQAIVENVPLVTDDDVMATLPGMRTRW